MIHKDTKTRNSQGTQPTVEQVEVQEVTPN